MGNRKKVESAEVSLQASGVSRGVAVGPAVVIAREDEDLPVRVIPPGDAIKEIARFERAVIETRRQLRDIQRNMVNALGKGGARIFEMHQMVLEDGLFIDRVIRKIREEHKNAEPSVREAGDDYSKALSAVQDEYLRERVADIRDVARRIIRNLMGRQGPSLSNFDRKCIVVAWDLGPSETAMLRKDHVLAFVTEGGSSLSHTAIMARAMEIPAVVGLHEAASLIATGDELLVDGDKGLVIINPTLEHMQEYGKLVEVRQKMRREMTVRIQNRKAVTPDGRAISVEANIELAGDCPEARHQGAEGVGLMRSEFLFMTQDQLPDEETQVAAYCAVAEGMAPQPVIIRTLDSGGDKIMPSFRLPAEVNPFLGFRAIRFCLAYPDIFLTQLRAILRASASGNVKIMYPMITDVDELLRANVLLEEAKDQLRRQRIPFNEGIDVGAMIETPAAAISAHILSRHVRFFSLGTNDLIQYTMAVDRVNDRVAYLYEPTHPAVLRMIRSSVEAGRQRSIRVGVCGEMAGDPLMTPLLVGLGVDSLSMAPASIPLVKTCILKMPYAEARELAERAMELETPREIFDRCRDMIGRIAPDVLDLISHA
jgi:phosphotransferase system enzyme I (PtsI)